MNEVLSKHFSFKGLYGYLLAWMPTTSPPTTFFGGEVRSGLDPLRSRL